MKQHFYVIFNKKEKAFYIDDMTGISCFTKNILDAERYTSYDKAYTELKYFKSENNCCVKKVNVCVNI